MCYCSASTLSSDIGVQLDFPHENAQNVSQVFECPQNCGLLLPREKAQSLEQEYSYLQDLIGSLFYEGIDLLDFKNIITEIMDCTQPFTPEQVS